jgi:hypothetical protein
MRGDKAITSVACSREFARFQYFINYAGHTKGDFYPEWFFHVLSLLSSSVYKFNTRRYSALNLA